MKTMVAVPVFVRSFGDMSARLIGRVKGDLHGTTLSHATDLRQAYDTNR